MVVYKITNIINSKVYIGLTTQKLHRRFCVHKGRAVRGGSGYLYNAMRKYGIDNFNIETIYITKDIQDLKNAESVLIKEYNSFDSKYGYNLTSGGEHCIVDELTRKRLSTMNIGKKFSKSHKDKLSNASKKKWKIIIDGTKEIIINDLPAFCEEHGLKARSLRLSAYKKYKAKRLS